MAAAAALLQLDGAWRLKMCDKDNPPKIAGSDVSGNRVYDVATVIELVATAINVNPSALDRAEIENGTLTFDGAPLVHAATLRRAIENLADRGDKQLSASRAAAATQYIVTCICKCKLGQCDTTKLADDIMRGVDQLNDGTVDGTMANHLLAIKDANKRHV
jgi:hypothetical protein